MNREKLQLMISGIEPWQENFGQGMERRGADGMSWYDLSVNCNALPCEPDTAIIVTAWFGQLKFLRAVLEQYRLSRAFVILAYDNPFYAFAGRNSEQILHCMPNINHFLLANAFVMKHLTYDGNKRNGWSWDVIYARGIISNFKNIKYVYVTNGDCICEKPEGFKEIIKLLDDDDLIAGQSNESKIHTATMFFKIDAFNKVVDYIYESMRVPVIGSRSPEMMVIEAVKEYKIKVKHAPQQPIDPIDGTVDFYARRGQPSTWREILGFHNLFAEMEEAWNEGLEPIDKKYLDFYEIYLYFSGEERETICNYYETQDRRYLYQYWDRGESSDYNRLYYPLSHYGTEPIYSENK